MAYELFTPGKYKRRRQQGPPKIVVDQSPNGRTTLRLSAAVRDWLEPVVGDRPWEDVLKVAIYIDHAAHKVLISRREPGDTGDGVYEVRGLRSSAYFGDFGIAEMIGLRAGHYPAILVGTEVDISGHGVEISIDDRTDHAQPVKKRAPKQPARVPAPAPVQAPPAPSRIRTVEAFDPGFTPSVVSDSARIREIQDVLSEGVTLVTA